MFKNQNILLIANISNCSLSKKQIEHSKFVKNKWWVRTKASVAWADFSRSLAALAALSKAVESKEYCWERYPSTSCPTVPTPAGPPAPEIKFRKCYNVWKLVISNLVLITAKVPILSKKFMHNFLPHFQWGFFVKSLFFLLQTCTTPWNITWIGLTSFHLTIFF